MGKASSRLNSLAETVKKNEKHLLLSTTYGLNSSCTKRVVTGLVLNKRAEPKPIIKLVNATGGQIVLQQKTWNALGEQLDIISDYLDFDVYADAQWYLDKVDLGDYVVTFTTAHGERAIRLDPVPDADDASSECTDEEDTPSDETRPLCKRRKLYHPSFVMKKTTFDGLKTVFGCVDEQVLRLQRLTKGVGTCITGCIHYLTTKVSASAPKRPSLQTITELAQRDFDIIRERVRAEVEPGFREHYFDIVFTEFMKLFSHILAYIVKKNTDYTVELTKF